MPRTYIKIEYFEFIEKMGSVTVEEFAQRMWISRAYAASWLSKWARKDYLTLEPYQGSTRTIRKERGRPRGSLGRYRNGPKWWGELAYGANREFG